jgi:hypothetical protein
MVPGIVAASAAEGGACAAFLDDQYGVASAVVRIARASGP